MSEMSGYLRTNQLATERPDLLPLLRLIFDMGDEAFNEGLDVLVERGLLDRDVIHDPPIT
jgi:hypothetical protein